MSTINWPVILRAGLQRGGLKPAEFWALTPAELMMMLGVGGSNTPLTRSGLERLIEAFPDEEKGFDDGGS